MLKMVIRDIPDTIHVFSAALVQLDTVSSPDEASDDRKLKNLTFYLTLDVVCDLQKSKIFGVHVQGF